MSKIIEEALPVSAPDTVFIKDFIPSLKNASITEIEGVRFDIYTFYVNFFVYRAEKDVVLKSVNSIKAEKSGDGASYSICTQVSAAEAQAIGVPDDHNKYTKLFWHFRQLKNFVAYGCVKAHWRHRIIFDSNSDTVYHMIEEIKD